MNQHSHHWLNIVGLIGQFDDRLVEKFMGNPPGDGEMAGNVLAILVASS